MDPRYGSAKVPDARFSIPDKIYVCTEYTGASCNYTVNTPEFVSGSRDSWYTWLMAESDVRDRLAEC